MRTFCYVAITRITTILLIFSVDDKIHETIHWQEVVKEDTAWQDEPEAYEAAVIVMATRTPQIYIKNEN